MCLQDWLTNKKRKPWLHDKMEGMDGPRGMIDEGDGNKPQECIFPLKVMHLDNDFWDFILKYFWNDLSISDPLRVRCPKVPHMK